jgi:VWFA-related protein
MARRRLSGVILAVAWLATPPAPAGSEDPRGASSDKRPGRPTFSSDLRTVRVPVSVLDRDGDPVLGLQAEDFRLEEEGKPREVTFFSGERKPLRLALALDVSVSMTERMSEVADALGRFIDLLEPDDEILVMTFSDEVQVEQDFTSDRELLQRVFARLQPAGGTALHDAAEEAIRRVAQGPAEGKAVVLVTDGVDTASRITFAELRELARRSEVPVFSIGIGTEVRLQIVSGSPGGIGGGPTGPRIPRGWPGGVGGRGRPRGPGRGWPGWPGGPTGGPSDPGPHVTRTEADFDAQWLRELADETGGRAVILTGLRNDRGRIDRLKDAAESIALTLRHRYLVGYEPGKGKKGWRRIEVEVERPSLKVKARKGYYAEG